MSTILKALKKVEGKREPISVKKEIPRSLKSPLSDESRNEFKKKYAIIVLLLVLTAGGVAGYRFWPSSHKPEVYQNNVDDSKVPNSLAEQPATVVPMLSQEQVQVTETIKPITASQANSARETEFQRSTSKKIQSELLAKKSTSREPAPEPEPQAQSQIQSRPVTVVNSNPSPQPASDVEKSAIKADISILQDRRLEIQALVYSSDAAKRMIVLNGEILREGTDYKGYLIEAIEPKRVLVRKNGEVSALLFGK